MFAWRSLIVYEHLMQFCVMMHTSFDANLVRAELSDVGVARALTLFERKNFFRLLVFQIFLHIMKAAVFVHPMVLAI